MLRVEETFDICRIFMATYTSLVASVDTKILQTRVRKKFLNIALLNVKINLTLYTVYLIVNSKKTYLVQVIVGLS